MCMQRHLDVGILQRKFFSPILMHAISDILRVIVR